MRTLLGCLLFLFMTAAILIGWALETSWSLRNPWTWILALLGALIAEGLIYLIYRKKPSDKRSSLTAL